MNQMKEKIQALKKEKDAAILAHYYAPDEVQEAADYVGDSYYLARLAAEIKETTLVFCGVSFMGESAKALNPQKRVLMPDMNADCPMAHMASSEKIKKIKEKYEDVAVVCYVNSTAELKACSDVCVTSSNALKIVKALPNKRIYFIPDENLGRYIAGLLPEKEFIFNDGFCHVHASLTAEEVKEAKNKWQTAEVLAHPECRPEVLAEADYIGSTAGIIDYAAKSAGREFIVCTEEGVLFQLRRKNPDKRFYMPGCSLCCADMKKNTLEKLVHVLETGENEVLLPETLGIMANKPLENMLKLAK
ncbi:MAG: quinolinate synthase NadA [Ruminococcus sp.]|jgi:quinolinate synthase